MASVTSGIRANVNPLGFEFARKDLRHARSKLVHLRQRADGLANAFFLLLHRLRVSDKSPFDPSRQRRLRVCEKHRASCNPEKKLG